MVVVRTHVVNKVGMRKVRTDLADLLASVSTHLSSLIATGAGNL